MPKGGKSKSKESVRGGGSGGGRRKHASIKRGIPSGVSSRLRSGSTTGSECFGEGAVPVDVVNRRLHNPDDSAVVEVLLEALLGAGGPSASLSSNSLAGDTSVEGSPPHPPQPAEGIGVPPTSSTVDGNVLGTPEAAREGMGGDKTLSCDSTADS